MEEDSLLMILMFLSFHPDQRTVKGTNLHRTLHPKKGALLQDSADFGRERNQIQTRVDCKDDKQLHKNEQVFGLDIL